MATLQAQSQAKPIAGPVNALSWSPDGNRVLAAGFDEAAILDARLELKERIRLPNDGQLWGAAWSPDGRWIAMASDGGVSVREATGGKVRRISERTGALAVSFSPTAAGMLAASFADGSSLTLDVSQTQATPIRLETGGVPLVAIVWSPDGRRIATGGLDASVHIWDLDTRKQVAKLGDVGRLDINGLAWSPDGRLLAAATQVGDIVLFDVDHGLLMKALSGAKGWSRGVTFNGAGNQLAAAGEDGVLRIWQVSDWSFVATATASADSVWALAWSARSNALVSGGGQYQSTKGDTTIRIWAVGE